MLRGWIFISLLWGLAAAGRGEDVFVAQEGRGEGASAGQARAAAWFNDAANWGEGARKIGPGDTVHLCGVIATALTVQGDGAEGRPVTILFEPGAKLSAPYWTTWTPPQGVRGLPVAGALNLPKRRHIVIDGGKGGVIEATETGTDWPKHPYSQAGVCGGNCQDVEVKNLRVLNMYNRTEGSDDYWSIGSGVTLTGTRNRIHDVYVEKAFYGLILGAGSAAPVAKGNQLYNCEVNGCSVGINAAMGSDGVRYEGVEIHHNRVHHAKVWDGVLSQNPYDKSRRFHRRDGIKIWGRPKDPNSTYAHLKIHHNVVGPEMSHMRGTMSGWLCIDTGTFIEPEIHHNLFLSGAADGQSAFIVLSGRYGAPTQVNSRIHHNTFIGNGRDVPIRFGMGSQGHQVWDNLFFNYSLGYYSSTQDTEIAFWDYNNWCPARPPGRFAYKDHHSSSWARQRPYSFADWRTMLGFDAHSLAENPIFVNSDNPAGPDGKFFTADDGLALDPKSPLIGAGCHGGDIGAYGRTKGAGGEDKEKVKESVETR